MHEGAKEGIQVFKTHDENKMGGGTGDWGVERFF